MKTPRVQWLETSFNKMHYFRIWMPSNLSHFAKRHENEIGLPSTIAPWAASIWPISWGKYTPISRRGSRTSSESKFRPVQREARWWSLVSVIPSWKPLDQWIFYHSTYDSVHLTSGTIFECLHGQVDLSHQQTCINVLQNSGVNVTVNHNAIENTLRIIYKTRKLYFNKYTWCIMYKNRHQDQGEIFSEA